MPNTKKLLFMTIACKFVQTGQEYEHCSKPNLVLKKKCTDHSSQVNYKVILVFTFSDIFHQCLTNKNGVSITPSRSRNAITLNRFEKQTYLQ